MLCKPITKSKGNPAPNTIPVPFPFHHLIIIIHFFLPDFHLYEAQTQVKILVQGVYFLVLLSQSGVCNWIPKFCTLIVALLSYPIIMHRFKFLCNLCCSLILWPTNDRLIGKSKKEKTLFHLKVNLFAELYKIDLLFKSKYSKKIRFFLGGTPLSTP